MRYRGSISDPSVSARMRSIQSRNRKNMIMKSILKYCIAMLPAVGMAILCGCSFGEEITAMNDDSRVIDYPEGAVTTTTETTVTTTVTQNPTHDIPLGDFDYNGKIEADDAQKVLNVYAEIVAGNDPKLTDMQKEVADVNKDGTVDVIDAQYILIFYVEFTVSGNYSITWEQIIGKKN